MIEPDRPGPEPLNDLRHDSDSRQSYDWCGIHWRPFRRYDRQHSTMSKKVLAQAQAFQAFAWRILEGIGWL